MTACEPALTALILLVGCATGSDTADTGDATDTATTQDSSCSPSEPGDVLPTADRTIPDVVSWEAEPEWPAGCVVSFGSPYELVRLNDATESWLVTTMYCDPSYGNLILMDVSASAYSSAVRVPLPSVDHAFDAGVDFNGDLRVVYSDSESAWMAGAGDLALWSRIALPSGHQPLGEVWMGEDLFVYDSELQTYRFKADFQRDQTTADAEGVLSNWYDAANVADVDGDGLEDVAVSILAPGEAIGMYLVSSAEAIAADDDLPPPFARPAAHDPAFYPAAQPVGDQDGDGVGDVALVDWTPAYVSGDDPSVVRVFAGADLPQIAAIEGFAGLKGNMGYVETGDGPPVVALWLTMGDYAFVQGPLCGTMDGAAAATILEAGRDRHILGWVGGPNYLGQWTGSRDDPDDLTAALYIWE